MAPVLEITLAVNLDIFPRKLLAQPVIARVGRHLDGQLTLGGVYFLLQENIDAKWAYIGILNCGVGGQNKARANQVRGQVCQSLDLGQELLFAAVLPHPLTRPGRAQQEKSQPAQNEQADPENSGLAQCGFEGHARRLIF